MDDNEKIKELEDFSRIAGSQAVNMDEMNGDELSPADSLRKAAGVPVAIDEDEPNTVTAVGGNVQYALHGPGYTPTTKTVQTLPAGLYRIEVIDRIPTLVPHRVSTDSLLRLPDSRSDEVVKEIELFWPKKELFTNLGFMHKRGFLLWGPQGSGKTSTLNIIATEMVKVDGIVIYGSCHPNLLTEMLLKFREIEPERSLVVAFEDIDTIIKEYGEQQVLNILDGESSINNVVFLATTNYPEKLDPRIINRPSRFDEIIFIGMPTAEARATYLDSRKLPLSSAEKVQWVKETAGFSIAQLKEVVIAVICLGHSLKHTITRLKGMSKTPNSDSTSSNGVGFNS